MNEEGRYGDAAACQPARLPGATPVGWWWDLNGKVIGITIGSSGSRTDITGYAIPINTALADARQIASSNP